MDGHAGGHDAGLVRLALAVLTLTSAAAVYRAVTARDAGAAAFVAASDAALLLLFRRLRAFERLPPADHRLRGRLKRDVWALCTLLTVLFAWKVAAVMPSWPVAAAVLGMGGITVVGGFVALFRQP